MGAVMLGLWLQDAGGVSSRNTTLLTIFVGLVALAMLTQAAVVLALGIGAMKAQKKLLEVANDLKKQAAPAIAKAQDLISDTVPKVKVITGNLVETSHMVRNKVQDFEGTLTTANEKLREATETFAEANSKTRGQIHRVDGMITSALKATSEIGAILHHSIEVPARQVAGVVTGLRVGLEQLLGKVRVQGESRK
jgi:hypothetical protein